MFQYTYTSTLISFAKSIYIFASSDLYFSLVRQWCSSQCGSRMHATNEEPMRVPIANKCTCTPLHPQTAELEFDHIRWWSRVIIYNIHMIIHSHIRNGIGLSQVCRNNSKFDPWRPQWIGPDQVGNPDVSKDGSADWRKRKIMKLWRRYFMTLLVV